MEKMVTMDFTILKEQFENKKDDLDTQIKNLSDQIGEFDPSKMAPPKIIGGGSD